MQKIVKMSVQDRRNARPEAMLVQIACQYASEIYLEAGSKKVNAKSIMGMMTISLNAGEDVKIQAAGGDEAQAVAEMEKYLTGTV